MFVETYIPFARKRAGPWIAKYPHLRDDLVSTALICLVIGFKHHIPHSDTEIKKYITVVVNNGIRQYLADSHLIRIPRSELKRRRKLGMTDFSDTIVVPFDNPPKAFGHPPWATIFEKEVRELLNLSDLETAVLDLRIEGYSLKQIGECVNYSQPALTKILQRIQRRYLHLAKKYKEIRWP